VTGGDGLPEQLPADATGRREDRQLHGVLPRWVSSRWRRVYHLDDRGEGNVTTRADCII